MALIKPQQIVLAILTYGKHLAEWTGETQPKRKIPQFILKAPCAVTSNNKPIILPDLSDSVELENPWGWCSGEVELAMVVKKRASQVSAKDAEKYIEGFTIVNDVTQRDLEKTMGYPYSMTKSFPTFGPIGPRIVSHNKLGNPNDLKVEMRINGKAVQQSSTSQLIYPVEELFSWASRLFALEKGDVVSTGTPEGCLSYKLAPGDVMEAEVEGIGVLRNPVVFRDRKQDR